MCDTTDHYCATVIINVVLQEVDIALRLSAVKIARIILTVLQKVLALWNLKDNFIISLTVGTMLFSLKDFYETSKRRADEYCLHITT